MMKAKDIQIGETYVAKVSGKLTTIRIRDKSPYGGWNAVNTITGRTVRIKTAARLRYRVNEPSDRTLAGRVEPEQGDETMNKDHEQWKTEAVKPLREWLVAKHARCNWSAPIPQIGTISGYVVNGRLFIILDFADGGWEAFTAVPEQQIDETLRALEVVCGLRHSSDKSLTTIETKPLKR